MHTATTSPATNTAPANDVLCDALAHSLSMCEVLEDAARGNALAGRPMSADTVRDFASALGQMLFKAQGIASELDDFVMVPMGVPEAMQFLERTWHKAETIETMDA